MRERVKAVFRGFVGMDLRGWGLTVGWSNELIFKCGIIG